MSKTKLEMKVRNLEECIKEKDERITRLEHLNKDKKVNRANLINFCGFFYLIVTLLVFGTLYYIYQPDNTQFKDFIALAGMSVLTMNAFFTIYFIIYEETKKYDYEFMYWLGNMVGIPMSLLFSGMICFGSIG